MHYLFIEKNEDITVQKSQFSEEKKTPYDRFSRKFDSHKMRIDHDANAVDNVSSQISLSADRI